MPVSYTHLDVYKRQSHILAQAVKRLFPKTRLGIGPAIEDGFYYDFDTEHGFVSDDLAVIEAEMARIIKENLPVCREVMSREEARALFEQMQEPFKLEILEEIPEDEPVSIYRQGEFVDLCAGPHVPSTGYVKTVSYTHLDVYKRQPQFPSSARRSGTVWLHVHPPGEATAAAVPRWSRQYRAQRKGRRTHNRWGPRPR